MRRPGKLAARVVAGILLLLWAPTVTADPCAIGGTADERREEPEGLGGTGLGDATQLAGGDRDSGMGGTGLGDEAEGLGGTGLGDEPDGLGGTGVVGTITGFGSICVNGLRIAYDSHTPTEVNHAAASADSLRVGDVVAVQAERVGDSLRANSIAVRQLVRGQLDAVAPASRRLQLLGQQVELPEQWASDAFAALSTGDRLAISGLRVSDGRILATRLTILESPGEASLIGTLALAADGAASVAGVGIAPEAPIDPALSGVSVIATGVWNAADQRIDGAEVVRAVHFDRRTEEVSLGGYVEAQHAGVVRVGGLRVETPHAMSDRIRPDDYIVVRGVLTHSGTIRALRVARDVRPPPHQLPRPPRIERPPDRARPSRPPRIDAVRPLRVQKLLRP